MQLKYPACVAIIKKHERWKGEKEDDEISNIPKFYENTPGFGANNKNNTKDKCSDAGSVVGRRKALVTHSFAKTLSRPMGDWQQ